MLALSNVSLTRHAFLYKDDVTTRSGFLTRF